SSTAASASRVVWLMPVTRPASWPGNAARLPDAGSAVTPTLTAPLAAACTASLCSGVRARARAASSAFGSQRSLSLSAIARLQQRVLDPLFLRVERLHQRRLVDGVGAALGVMLHQRQAAGRRGVGRPAGERRRVLRRQL